MLYNQTVHIESQGSLSSKTIEGRQGLAVIKKIKKIADRGYDSEKELIYFKKIKISYKKIQKQLKFYLIETYMKCLEKGCLNNLMMSKRSKRSRKNQNIIITDEDALSLISKMSQNLQRIKIEQQIGKFQKKLQYSIKEIQKLNQFQESNKEKLKHLQLVSRVNQNKQLDSIIYKFQIYLGSIEGRKKEDQLKIKNIQRNISQLKEQLSVYQLHSPNNLYKDLLGKTIRKMARNLLIQTILFIVEISKSLYLLNHNQKDQTEVYVIFEQSYHSIKMKKRYLIQIISSKVYLDKLAVYQNLYTDSVYNETAQDFMCCHKCMKIYPNDELLFCKNEVSLSETMSYASTDHNYYRQRRINGNYDYRGSKQFVLPYFIYNQINNKHKCQRAFCNKCLKQRKEKCQFCIGNCNCNKCILAYSLVKMIGFDKDDPNIVRSYDKILNLLSNFKQPYKIQILNLRDKDDFSQFKRYSQFQKINPDRKIINSIRPPIKQYEQKEVNILDHFMGQISENIGIFQTPSKQNYSSLNQGDRQQNFSNDFFSNTSYNIKMLGLLGKDFSESEENLCDQ